MLKSLIIRNFQSHRKSILHFSKGVNVIIGKTDSGKSAIIRALRLVMTNTPNGDAFRSYWGGETMVSLSLWDKELPIKRIRGAQNKYVLGEQTFTGIGTTVPEPISKILNISDINMQAQLDSHFLLSNNSGEVARFFNKVARLDKIDSGQKNIRSSIRAIEKDIAYNEQTIKENNEKIQAYNYIYKAEVHVEDLVSQSEKLKKRIQRRANLLNMIAALSNIEKQLSELQPWQELEERVSALLAVYDKLDKAKRQKEELFLLAQRINKTKDDISQAKQITKASSRVESLLKKYASFDKKKTEKTALSSLLANLENIETQIEEYTHLLSYEDKANHLLKMIDKRQDLKKQRAELEYASQNVIDADEFISKKTKKLSSMMQTFEKEFPDVCPLCGEATHHKH